MGRSGKNSDQDLRSQRYSPSLLGIANFRALENAVDAPTPKSHVPKVEVAKTGSGKCFDCKEKILKGEVRIQLKASNFHPACLKKLDVLKCSAQE